ncbi:MAG: topology modulation protein [Clostridia bacterium]|nr:topology modulation protein [Clostridia bacterium]
MIEAKKIAVIGGSGTGKTTLTTNLGKDLNLPVMHIDGVHHLENWEIRDKEERDKIILEKANTDRWIIDGTYTSTLEDRVKLAELVIYLDYSSFSQVKGVLKRYLKHPGEDRPEMPGCPEKMSWEFLKWVWNWRKNKREKVLKAISQVDSSKILIFKSRRQLNKWYYKNFNHKIKVEF